MSSAIKTLGTTSIVSKVTGQNRSNDERDVKAVQQLLTAAGYYCKDDGDWGDGTQRQYEKFQRAKLGPKNTVNYINTSDSGSMIVELARQAGIVFDLPGGKGIKAGIKLSNSLYWQAVYAKKWDCPIYGIVGKTAGIMIKDKKFVKGPLQLDCTTYANLVISIIRHGSLNNSQYIASTMGIGNTDRQLWHRYGLSNIENKGARDPKAFQEKDSADRMKNATSSGNMYLVGVAKLAQGGVGHYALFYHSSKDVLWMLHANTGHKNQGRGGIHHDKIDDFVTPRLKKRQYFYLFGPI